MATAAQGTAQKFQPVSQSGLAKSSGGTCVTTQVPSPGYIQVQMRCILADQSTVFYAT